MIGLLKMEFRRLFKSFFFWAYPVIIVVLLIINKLAVNEKQDEIALTVVLELSANILYIAMIVCGILMVSFWSKEDKQGYTKNILGNVSGRHILTIVKLITSTCVMLFYSVFNFIYCFVSYKIEFEKMVKTYRVYRYPESADLMPKGFEDRWISREQYDLETAEYFNKSINRYLLMILVGLVIMALIVLLYELLRSATFAYVMVILVSTQLIENLFLNFAALITDKIDPVAQNLLFTQFYYFDEYASVGEEMNPGLPLWTFWVRNIIYLTVFAASAILVSKKKDSV